MKGKIQHCLQQQFIFSLPLLLTLCGITGLSGLAFWMSQQLEAKTRKQSFEQDAAAIGLSIQRSLDENIKSLESIVALYHASEKVERQEFQKFVQGFLEHNTAIQALEWIPHVPLSQRATFRQIAQQDGFPDFQITERDSQGNLIPAKQRPDYFPVYFVEPLKGNETALGFDLASDPTRLQALNQSRDQGKAIATPPIQLVQTTSKSNHGVLVFLPVYNSQHQSTAIASRRQNLQGFALSVFWIQGLMDRAVDFTDSKGFDVYIFDPSLPNQSRLLYVSLLEQQERVADLDSLQQGLFYSTGLELGGRKWLLVARPNAASTINRPFLLPWLIVSMGSVLAVGLMVYSKKQQRIKSQLQQAKATLEQSIAERTNALQASNQQLSQEISERRQREAQVHDMTQRLELATSSAEIGVWDLDLIADRLIWDDRMYQLYGLKPEEFGGAYEAWKKGVYPDDLAAADANIQDAITGQREFHPEFRVLWPNGQIRYIQAHAIVLRDDTGKAQRMIGVNWDITARKQAEVDLRESEARWQFALEGAGDGVWDWNAETNEVFFSHQWKAMLGFADDEIGNALEEWDKRIHPDDREQCYADLNQHLKAQSPVYQNEHRVLCKDGTYKWILDRGKVVERDAEGQPLRVIGTHTDIDDLKQAEADLKQINEALEIKVLNRTQQLEQRAQELERSNAELEQFAYVASHDLQEPLRTIGSYTELLAEEYGDRLDGEADEYVHFIVDGATRMQQLIRDLLAFSRVGTRGKELKPVSTEEVVQTVLNHLKLVITEQNAVITYDALPPVMADQFQIQQLFQNLISNALKFHGDQQPQIYISATVGPTMCEFCVRDNGIGIESEYFDQIFEIFQRLHSRRYYDGTGIGLAICRKIVQRHGGQIWIDSTPGEGTSFYFTMPKINTPSLQAAGD